MWILDRRAASILTFLVPLLLVACGDETTGASAPQSDVQDDAEPSQTDASKVAGSAGQFFLDSNVRVNFVDGQFWLRLETPEPVLCAVNYGPDGGSLVKLAAMDMTAPAVDHDLLLPLDIASTYRFELTAFSKDHEVFRSAVYSVSAEDAAAPELDLIATVGEGARVISNFDTCDLEQDLVATDVLATSASLSFISSVPTLASSAYGPAPAMGSLLRASGTSPFTQHDLDLLALDPSTEYRVQTLLVDEMSTVCIAGDITFATLEAEIDPEKPTLLNVALLAEGAFISGVSSNWGGSGNESSFGANNAIDGDHTTEWSSASDGDDAWIEITLSETATVTSIGFWTRTMGSSAQISRFSVTNPEEGLLGEFDLPDAKGLFVFEVPETTADSLRFDVVTSSGGNTGVRTIEIYSALAGE